MDTIITTTNFLLLITLIIVNVSFVHGGGPTVTDACAQTPNPDLCNQLTAVVDTQAPDLRRLSIMDAMKHAMEAHRQLLTIISSSSNFVHNSLDERQHLRAEATSAWYDCAELYEEALGHLNRSLGSSTSDSQTWLSAALANRQTCRDGFLDLNLTTTTSLPRVMDDFSRSLRNSLAINAAAGGGGGGGRKLLSAAAAGGGGGARSSTPPHPVFPWWVAKSDRQLLEARPADVGPKAHLVVAQDGSGDYSTISEAVAASAEMRRGRVAHGHGRRRFVIYVKRGIYRESVEIKKSMNNIMLIGDGIDATIVSNCKNVRDGFTTYRSATFAVSGHGFIAKGMTFENTAGPKKHQAVALRSSSDLSVFYRCSFKGYQDTLYLHSMRQFYRDCDIYGTVDFIFGDAAAVLQGCNIYVRRPLPRQKATVTAQGRSDPNENTGIVIQASRVMMASADELAAGGAPQPRGSVEAYLGRPWRRFSRTVVMQSEVGGIVNPAGWLPWSGDFALSTLYYAEFMNKGIGGKTEGRVTWPGFHVIRSFREARKFTVGNFFDGDAWIPATGVPFDSGL
ncbi:unnamed protein product [Linum trigynum]|uniref:Pectinesterase n=1 Tax=Linum trigynum TaxID=586398 RepID=A0AAV2GRK4_9ROSI